jgi:hypothetical protein
MYNSRLPTQFLHGFQHSPSKKYAPFIVIGKKPFVFVSVYEFSLEIIFVVNEIDLHTGCGNGSYLYDKGTVYVFDDDVHSGQANDFV